jgi:hypothetical protein
MQEGQKMAEENNGFKVVLTADRTLMSEYSGGIFLRYHKLDCRFHLYFFHHQEKNVVTKAL